MKLSKEQRAVVESTAANILVIAGPGSGKTATMVARIAHLMTTGTDAAGIVCITFTNAGAKELASRLLGAFGPMEGEPIPRLGYVGTLHGFALRELQRHGSALGYGPKITVLDEAQTAEMLARVAKETGYNGTQKKLEATMATWRQSPGTRALRTPADITVCKFHRELREASAVTYDAILWDFLELITATATPYNEAAKKARRLNAVGPAWDHLIVDEFQDSGPVDALIYDALPVAHRCRVGDPDQGIYGFRGAELGHILALAGNMATEVHTLEGNYRCKPAICSAANRLIGRNTKRVQKHTRSVHTRDPEGDGTLPQSAGLVRKLPFGIDDDERMHVLWEVQKEIINGTDPAEIAVLSRYNATAFDFAEVAKTMGIPVRQKSEDRPPRDWQLARAAIELVNAPQSALAARQWLRLRYDAETAAAAQRKADLGQVGLASLVPEALPPAGTELGPADLPTWLARMGIARESVERVEAVAASMVEPTLSAISYAVTRDLDHQQEEGSGVTFTTIHGAKGREWAVVYVVACEQEIIPGRRGDLEEERRLMFVAVTRAKACLTVTHASHRRQTWGDKRHAPSTPSQFLAELAE